MSKIGVIGNSEFILGFQLAGISDTFNVRAGEDPLIGIQKMMEDKDISIVIMDERLVERVDLSERGLFEDSIEPVFITLSTVATQEGLKNMIKKSIGIDLWKGE